MFGRNDPKVAIEVLYGLGQVNCISKISAWFEKIMCTICICVYNERSRLL